MGLLLFSLPALAAPTPFERIAIEARARWAHDVLALSYEPASCSIRAVTPDAVLHIPLREVTWTLGKDNVVTGHCAGCMSGTAESHTTGTPHDTWTEHVETSTFVFRFETTAARAKELVRDLNLFAVRWCPRQGSR